MEYFRRKIGNQEIGLLLSTFRVNSAPEYWHTATPIATIRNPWTSMKRMRENRGATSISVRCAIYTIEVDKNCIMGQLRQQIQEHTQTRKSNTYAKHMPHCKTRIQSMTQVSEKEEVI
jgi:hypothetical protein